MIRRNRIIGMRRLVASVSLAASLSSVALAAAPQAEAASCVYYVGVFAYIHENPSTNSKIVAWDSAFTRLTGPCRSSGGFIAVYNSAARDGIG